MDHMWSPWRARHLEDKSAPDESDETLFARLVKENNDAENLILWRGEHVFVIMNQYPYNNGHLMVVPYRQVAAYEKLSTEEQVELTTTIERCIRWLRAALSPDGFNVGMNLGTAAGAGIPDHLHLHIVPRWSGDTNFMPTTAQTKVIPEALDETYKKLQKAIASEQADE